MARKAQNTMCLEGLYYLVVLLFIVSGAFFRQINLLFILAGMMIGPLIYNWRMVVAMMRGLSIRRRLPEGVCAGDLLVVEFVATRTKSWVSSWAIIVRDRVQRLAPGEPEPVQTPELFLPMVRSEGEAIESYRGRIARRGRYQFGPFTASTRFPLGLVRRTVRFDQTEELIVCPRIGQLTRKWNDISHAALHGTAQSRGRQGLVEGDFYGLRDWRSGDSRRWIHWRTSARRGTLAVRQFDQPRMLDLVMLVDLWQPEEPTEQQRQTVETVVSFAATVAEDICRRGGGNLRMGVAAESISLQQGSASRALLQEIMEQLAVAEATRDDHLPELLASVLSNSSRDARVVVVGTRKVDPADMQRFSQIWDNPSQRHRMQRAQCIDASAGELDEFFMLGEVANEAAGDLLAASAPVVERPDVASQASTEVSQ